MERPSQSGTRRLSIVGGCLLVGLALGACGGDDDSATGGSGGESGSLSIGGSGGSGASGAEPSGSAGESVSVGGAEGGSDASAAGQSVGGSASGGASGGGISSGGSAGSGLFLPCASQADCKAFGGGKVCCSVPGMQFCTKPSACSGKTLP